MYDVWYLYSSKQDKPDNLEIEDKIKLGEGSGAVKYSIKKIDLVNVKVNTGNFEKGNNDKKLY